MIRYDTTPLSTAHAEGRPTVAVVLPHTHDRPLVRTATALAQARRGRLRAFAVHAPGEELPPSLRLQLYGLWTASDADRAIRHLVDSAIYGARTPVQTLELGGGEHAVHDLGEDTPLVTGFVRGRSRLEDDEVRSLILRHPGDAVLVADGSGPAFCEVLALGSGAALAAIARPLGACYPLFEVPAPNAKAVHGALADATAETLVLLGLPPGNLGAFADFAGRLEHAAPGTVGAVLPRGRSREASLDALLG